MSAIALVSDLIFGTKIKSTAEEIGMPLSVVRTAEAVEAAADSGVNFAIIDLNAEGVDPIEVIRRCKAPRQSQHRPSAGGPEDASPGPMVIAFGSHVQKELIRAAEQAGADLVLPRSRFSAELPQLLAQYGQTHDAR